jgi:hypothetical protein
MATRFGLFGVTELGFPSCIISNFLGRAGQFFSGTRALPQSLSVGSSRFTDCRQELFERFMGPPPILDLPFQHSTHHLVCDRDS